jgi:hypothetical protein
MRYSLLMVYESDGRLAELLRSACAERKWSLREPRTAEACLRLLRRAGPCVFLLKVGQGRERAVARARRPLLEEEARQRAAAALEREFSLLEQVTWLYPEAHVVVVFQAHDPALADLAWDLGACQVFLPPVYRESFIAFVTDLMGATARP